MYYSVEWPEVRVAVFDPLGAGSTQSFNLVASANDPPTITSTPKLNTLSGATYRYTVQGFDPNGDSLTIAWRSSAA